MSALPADIVRPASRWQMALGTLCALLLGILIVHRETAIAMVTIWYRSETFTHAFLVPPMSLWLIWRQRDRLRLLEPQAMPWVLVPMAGLALMWLVGDLVAVNAATQFALVGMLVLAVPATLGWAVTREMLFPLGFLFFSVPFGEFLLPLLMDRTADFTVLALQLTGIPIYREGLRFVIPSGSWSVVEACSGVRYLIASLMVGSLFAYLNYRTPWRRWVFVGVSIAVPIVANWLRAYMIVMIGHLSNNTLAVGVDHLIYGWLFFGVVITLMFVIGSRWAEDPAPAPVATAASLATGAAATPGAGLLATAALALAIVWLPQGAQRWLDAPQAGSEPRLALPAALQDGWRGAETEGPPWQPQDVTPSATARRWYTRDGAQAGAHIAYYRSQNYERKLVSSQNVLVPSQDPMWNLVANATREVTLADGRKLEVRAVEILPTAGAAGRQSAITVWKLYWVDDRFVASDAEAKVLGVLGRLAGRGDDSAAIVVYTQGEGEAAARVLNGYLSSNLGALQELLRKTRDAR